jgi:preprotein translocase subunit YajC
LQIFGGNPPFQEIKNEIKRQETKMDFTNLMLLLAEAPPGEPEPNMMASMLMTMAPLGLFIFVFYFVLIRPESKRKKKAQDMLANIQIADEVVTAGGIIGRVIDAKPDADTIVIETGGDKTRIRILKSYIIENRTVHEND